MAKYSRAGWSGNVVEIITGAVTLDKNDSGKIFLCDAATVTLPAHADIGVGWHARFMYRSGASTVNSLDIDATGDFAEIVSDGSAFLNMSVIA